MNLRLRRRDSQGVENPNDDPMKLGLRRSGASELLAEYELVRTDGKVLRACDIVREPMMLHEQISVLKIKVQRLGLDVTRELQAVVSRLPTHPNPNPNPNPDPDPNPNPSPHPSPNPNQAAESAP